MNLHKAGMPMKKPQRYVRPDDVYQVVLSAEHQTTPGIPFHVTHSAEQEPGCFLHTL